MPSSGGGVHPIGYGAEELHWDSALPGNMAADNFVGATYHHHNHCGKNIAYKSFMIHKWTRSDGQR